jgi:hypothetical protein
MDQAKPFRGRLMGKVSEEPHGKWFVRLWLVIQGEEDDGEPTGVFGPFGGRQLAREWMRFATDEVFRKLREQLPSGSFFDLTDVPVLREPVYE